MSRRPWRSTSPGSTPPPNAATNGSSTSSATTAAGGTTTCPTARVEEAKLDTNVCAYIATGVWHHWLCTWDRAFVDHLWPTVQRALDWVLSMRRDDGTVLWACTDDDRPWNYSLLTGSSSHRPRPAMRRQPRGAHQRAATRLARGRRPVVRDDQRSSRRVRAQGPLGDGLVLPGACRLPVRRARPRSAWPTVGQTFAMEGLGIRCVSDEPWVTASETAECAIAHAAIGDLATATDLVRWTRPHRRRDGAYYTGLVYPGRDPRSRSKRSRRTPARQSSSPPTPIDCASACERRVRAALLHQPASMPDGLADLQPRRRSSSASTSAGKPRISSDCADSKLSGSSTDRDGRVVVVGGGQRSIIADASLLVNLPRA